MSRAPKAIDNCAGHRTKAEISARKAAESAALTGQKMHESPEIKADPIAHAEYRRISKILTSVSMNDALYESVINEYCQLKSDIARYVKVRQEIEEDAEIKPADRYKMMLDCDRNINTLKRRRFDIEKENGMTISSALRAIPKKPQTDTNPLLEALRDD